MTRLLHNPRLLTKYIDKKKEQLQQILQQLGELQLEDPARPRLLEQMLYLQKGIPELENLYAEISEMAGAGARTSPESVSTDGETLSPTVSTVPAVSTSRLMTERTDHPMEGDLITKWDQLSKGVREGKTVDLLYEGLRKMRSTFRETGWSATTLRKATEQELPVVWEWIERISIQERKLTFLDIKEWEDGAKFIFLQIATLYEYAPHLKKKPSWSTVRDWRKAYLGYVRHRTPDGRRPQ